MHFLFLSPRKQKQQVEQLRREISSEIQALQQTITSEIQKLTNSINTLHRCVDTLHSQVSQIRPLTDTITQLQRKVDAISSPPVLVYDGKLDASHVDFMDKTQIAANAINQHSVARQSMQEAFEEAQEKQNEVQKVLHDAAKNIARPPVDPQTDKQPAIILEKEASPDGVVQD